MIRTVLKAIDTIALVSSMGGLLAILAAAGLAVGNVLLRSVFGTSIYGVNDIVVLIVFVAIAACFPVAMKDRQHMRITILGEFLGGRSNRSLELISGLFTLVFLALLASQFIEKSQQISRYGSVSEIATIPLAPWWWCATVFLCGAVLLQLEVVLKDVTSMFTNPKEQKS